MLGDQSEEFKRLHDLLVQDFTIISFSDKEEAYDFILNYSKWFDAAVVFGSELDGKEQEFIQLITLRNPEISVGVVVDESEYFQKSSGNKLGKVNYLAKPIEDRSVNMFVSVARMFNKYQINLN